MQKIPYHCLLLLLLLALSIAARAQKGVITITNPLNHHREEVVAIPWNKIKAAYPNLDTAHFRVVNVATKREYPYQLEYRGAPQVQNLLVYIAVGARASISLQLGNGTPQKFAAKTFARFVPERKDDFAWENDRIAHRAYGKALEQTPAEMAYGIDVWVKRTESLVINKRYARGNYHVDAGDGLDYYHVGLTLGAGGIAPIIRDTIRYASTFSTWNIWDNGPLRSTFQLGYDDWMAGGIKVRMTKTVSIDAGTQFSSTEVYFKTDPVMPLPVVVGIIKRGEPGTLLLNEALGILAYWEPQHSNDGTTGVACLLPQGTGMQVTAEHLLARQVAQPGQPFVYFHGAAWSKGGSIQTAGDWFAYAQKIKTQLQQPLLVVIQ